MALIKRKLKLKFAKFEKLYYLIMRNSLFASDLLL